MQPTPPPVDITALTIEQLKALAYDQILVLNQTQANINAIQAEIAKRVTTPAYAAGEANKEKTIDYTTRERDTV
jgi:hypothetical protein